MTAAFAARASRHSLVLTGVVALHVGALVMMALGMKAPPLTAWVSKPIHVFEQPPPPKPEERPEVPDPAAYEPSLEPPPPLGIPQFQEPATQPGANDSPASRDAGRGPTPIMAVVQPPGLRTRDQRLAVLVDACYPATSRRLAEEGRIVARVVIGPDGRVTTWSVAQSAGYPRLDAAADCVLHRLEFVPGRRDGRAVQAEALLPIVFRLN